MFNNTNSIISITDDPGTKESRTKYHLLSLKLVTSTYLSGWGDRGVRKIATSLGELLWEAFGLQEIIMKEVGKVIRFSAMEGLGE